MMTKAILIFLCSAIFEVGGGYLVWIWLKHDKSALFGIAGFVLLGLYGVVATLQVEGFGRVYAAYGGIFIVFSIIWAMTLDGFKPDIWDLAGAALALCGVWIMMFAPRA